MKNLSSLFIFVVSTFLIASMAEAKSNGLEKLEQGVDFETGCSCSVTNAKDEFLVVSDLQDKAPAIVRINGTKQELKWISSTEKKGTAKKGDLFKRVYGDANYKLTLNYKTTSVCGKDDETCEVTRYAVDATLEEGKKQDRMKNLKGDCGC